MTLNQISDGQPVTYELLNAIITQVNSIVIPADDQKQNIRVVGNTIQTAEDDKVVIAVGSREIDVPVSGTKDENDIKFPSNTGFKAIPFITTSIIDYKGAGQGISFANATITSITKESFSVRVRLVSELKKSTTVRLNYIAIGSGSA
jgi:hypothetical protein